MKKKVWVVLGATEGLGPSTVKYLLSRDQAVIAPAHDDPARLCDSMKSFTGCHGPIDILINNLAYGFIDSLKKAPCAGLETQIEKKVRGTLDIVRLILPYMAHSPKGRIISIPPKPCLFLDSGEPIYDERADAVQQYCSRLKKGLPIPEDKISYLASKGNRSLWRE